MDRVFLLAGRLLVGGSARLPPHVLMEWSLVALRFLTILGFFVQKIRTIELEGKTVKLQIVSITNDKSSPYQLLSSLRWPTFTSRLPFVRYRSTIYLHLYIFIFANLSVQSCSGTRLVKNASEPSLQVTTEEHMELLLYMTLPITKHLPMSSNGFRKSIVMPPRV